MTDTLVTMGADLARALAKPPTERRWAMLIDLRKCVGCHACSLGCASEHKLPPNLYYRPVFEYETGTYPAVASTFLPRPCMQCDTPVCTATCPRKATWKETAGVAAGTVVIDYMRCSGCGQCARACPYGARAVDDCSDWYPRGQRQPWESGTFWEYGRSWVRTRNAPPEGKARKCHFCADRLAQGMLPECVSTCIGRATYFGDESDPASLIAQTIASSPLAPQVLKPAAGTHPRVRYIAREHLEAVHG
jgi:tetrathionate reductase subunit B